MVNKGLKPVFGGGPIGEGKDFPDVPTIGELYKLLKEGDCNTIDTARLYSNSEEWIGKTQGGDQFIIDSKAPGGFIVGGSNSAGILQHAKETVERLGVKNVSACQIGRASQNLTEEYRSTCTTSTVRTRLSISRTCSGVSTTLIRLATSSALG